MVVTRVYGSRNELFLRVYVHVCKTTDGLLRRERERDHLALEIYFHFARIARESAGWPLYEAGISSALGTRVLCVLVFWA